jgi:triosephosphate isomerase
VIVGHSERRQFFGDNDGVVAQKARAAVADGLIPIVCVGESLADREEGRTKEVLSQQFLGGPASLTPEEFSRILLAYEPVWAIGTGRTATPEIAGTAHAFIRSCVHDQFSAELAASVRILYGGSVKPDNIQGLKAQPDLDGALVGGASLEAKSFAAIVNCK